MLIEESDWEDAIALLSELIRAHPIYASEGMTTAQNAVLSYLQKNGWTNLFEDHFEAASINHHREYIEVENFGSLYQDYSKIPKRNLMALIESASPGPTRIFNGHIDVERVHSPEGWMAENGWKSAAILGDKIYGRGAADMLSGLVGMIAAANILRKHPTAWKGRIILTVVMDEEIGGNGTLRSLLWLEKHGYLSSSTQCLIAEPTDRTYGLSSLGFLHMILEIKNPPVHMSAAAARKNPLKLLSNLLLCFDDLMFQAAAQSVSAIDANSLVSNFGIIHGGDDAAIPIPTLHVEGVLFFPEELNPELFKIALCEKIKTQFPEIQIKWGQFFFKGASYPSFDLAEALKRLGIKEKIFRSPCDARLYKSFSIPVIIYGPGSLNQAHAIDEWVSLSELRKYINNLIQAISHGHTISSASATD